MPLPSFTRSTTLALSAALLLTTAPFAFAQDSDQPMTQSTLEPMADANGITHVTGGVGDDERDALEAVRSSYNVHITNSNKDGAYNDSTQITITDKAGTEVVTADAGPLFYVNLPAGSYTITAQHRDMQQQKKIKISKSKKLQPDLHFVW